MCLREQLEMEFEVDQIREAVGLGLSRRWGQDMAVSSDLSPLLVRRTDGLGSPQEEHDSVGTSTFGGVGDPASVETQDTCRVFVFLPDGEVVHGDARPGMALLAVPPGFLLNPRIGRPQALLRAGNWVSPTALA